MRHGLRYNAAEKSPHYVALAKVVIEHLTDAGRLAIPASELQRYLDELPPRLPANNGVDRQR